MENTVINAFMQQLLEQGLSVIVQILCSVLLVVLSVAISWVAAQIGKSKKFVNIEQAMWQLRDATETTVVELQKTLVDGLKAASADGKLTPAEIDHLHSLLVDGALKKMSNPAIKLLTATGVDLTSRILGVGEELLKRMEDTHDLPSLGEEE